MDGCATFAEVLDRAIGPAFEEIAGETAPRTATWWGTAPVMFVESAEPVQGEQVRRFPVRAWGFRQRVIADPGNVSSAAPMHQSRRLTPRQQAALADIVALGAHLETHFTLTELRGAFRRLAREFHPDHHDARSSLEKTYLTRVFAALAENYRCLLAACDADR